MKVIHTIIKEENASCTPLLEAAKKGSSNEEVEQLLRKYHNKHKCAVDDDIHEALWIATLDRNFSIGRMLLDWGADPSTVCYSGTPDGRQSQTASSVLHLACTSSLCNDRDWWIQEGSNFARLLLERGANPNPGHDCRGMTPLILATRAMDLELVRLLLDKGAKVDDKSNRSGKTPLMYAAGSRVYWNAAKEITCLLLEHGANINEPCGPFLETPLFAAFRWGALHLVSYLLANGADPNITNSRGETLFHLPRWDNLRNKIVDKMLLEAGADVFQSVDREGKTPLHAACECRDDFMRINFTRIQLFLDHGVSINALDNNGNAALDFAALHPIDACDAVTLLLDNGADPSISQSSALHFAAMDNQKYPALCALLHHGADVQKKDRFDNKLPLDYACEGSHLDNIFELLRAMVGVGWLEAFMRRD